MAFGVSKPTLTAMFLRAVVPLVIEAIGWRIAVGMIDRGRLVASSQGKSQQ